MKILESSIELEACSLIWKHLGVASSKLKAPGRNGYPDRIFWVREGKPWMVEFKRPGEEPTPQQLDIHETLRSLGYMVRVYTDSAECLLGLCKYMHTIAKTQSEYMSIYAARRIALTLLGRNE
jgi:hypothetical protein